MLFLHWARTKPTTYLLIFSSIWVIYIEQFVQNPKLQVFLTQFMVFTDEEKLFGGNSPDPEWEEFAVVAADLLERIQSSLSYNNTPYASSEDDADDANDDEFANSDVLKMSKTGFKMWLANS